MLFRFTTPKADNMSLRRLSFLNIKFLWLIFIVNYRIFVDAHRGRSREENMAYVSYEDFRNEVSKFNKIIEGTRQQVDTNTRFISDVNRFLRKLENIREIRDVLKQFRKMLSECSVNKIAEDHSNSYRPSERMVEDVQQREREFEMILGQSTEAEDFNCLVRISKTQLELERKLKDEERHRKSMEDRILAMEAEMKVTRLELQMVKRKTIENEDGLLNLSEGINVKNRAVQEAFYEMQNSIGSKVTAIEEKLKNSDDKLNDCDTINACFLQERPRDETLTRNLRRRLSKILNPKFRMLEGNLNKTQIFTQETREKVMKNDRRITNLLEKSNTHSTAVTPRLNGSVTEERMKLLETKLTGCDYFSECLFSTYPGKEAPIGNSLPLTRNQFFTKKVLTCRQERNEMQDMLENDNSSAMSAQFDGIFDELGSCLFSIKLLKAFKMQNETLQSDLFNINSKMRRMIFELHTLRSFNSNFASKYEEMNNKVQSMASNMSAFFESARRFQREVTKQFRRMKIMDKMVREESNLKTFGNFNNVPKEMAPGPGQISLHGNGFERETNRDLQSNPFIKNIGKNFKNIVQSSNRQEYSKSLRSGIGQGSIQPAKPVNNRKVVQHQ